MFTTPTHTITRYSRGEDSNAALNESRLSFADQSSLGESWRIRALRERGSVVSVETTTTGNAALKLRKLQEKEGYLTRQKPELRWSMNRANREESSKPAMTKERETKP